MDSERLEASQWFWYSAALEDAGVDDAEPASGVARVTDGMLTFLVKSRSRGQVTVGSIAIDSLTSVAADLDEVQLAAYRQHVRDVKLATFDIIADQALEMYLKRRAPLDALAEGKQRRKSRALEMHAAGRSVAYIAGALGVDRRTVQRYLAEK
jgi:hypothetical protein